MMNIKVGDITPDFERIVEIYADGSFLVSSPLDAQEVKSAIASGARLMNIMTD